MSLSTTPNVRWRQLVLESVAVVLSILLAFAIDAWWDARGESHREQTLLNALLEDFQSSRPGLVERATLARRMSVSNDLLVDLLEGRPAGGAVSVPDSLVLAVIGGPTYEPNTNALDAALASGEIELVESRVLRGQLANWRRALSDTTEDELEVRRITNDQVVPLLSRSVDLGGYMARVMAWVQAASGEGGPGEGVARVTASSELVGALALRGFYTRFSADDLEGLLRSLDAVVAGIREELHS